MLLLRREIFLCGDVLKVQRVMLIKWANFVAFLSWRLRRENIFTGDVLSEFHCTIPLIWHLIIQHLSSPKTRSFAFYHIKASSLKQVDIWDMFKKACNSVYINCCGISWTPTSYSINFFSYEDSRKQRRGPRWPWTSRWTYPNGTLFCSVGAVTKNTCKNLGQYRWSDNLTYTIIQQLPSPMGAKLTEFDCR